MKILDKFYFRYKPSYNLRFKIPVPWVTHSNINCQFKCSPVSQPEIIGPLITDYNTQANQRNSWTIPDWTSQIPLKVTFPSENNLVE